MFFYCWTLRTHECNLPHSLPPPSSFDRWGARGSGRWPQFVQGQTAGRCWAGTDTWSNFRVQGLNLGGLPFPPPPLLSPDVLNHTAEHRWRFSMLYSNTAEGTCSFSHPDTVVMNPVIITGKELGEKTLEACHLDSFPRGPTKGRQTSLLEEGGDRSHLRKDLFRPEGPFARSRAVILLVVAQFSCARIFKPFASCTSAHHPSPRPPTSLVAEKTK